MPMVNSVGGVYIIKTPSALRKEDVALESLWGTLDSLMPLVSWWREICGLVCFAFQALVDNLQEAVCVQEAFSPRGRIS